MMRHLVAAQRLMVIARFLNLFCKGQKLQGTVAPPGQKDDGGSNHVNTWRIVYDIPGIRDWLFEQHK